MIILDKYDLINFQTSTTLMDVVSPWSSSATYATGDEVSYENNKYKSTKDGNTDNINVELAWFRTAPTNSSAWSDDFPTTVSEKNGNIVLIFEDIPQISKISLANMYGENLIIQIKNGLGEVIFSETTPIFKEVYPLDYFEYWNIFEEPKLMKNYIKDLNIVDFGLKVTITITAKNGKSSLGFLAIGKNISLGCMIENITRKRDDNLEVFENGFGQKTVIGGKGWRSVDYQLWFNREYNQNEIEDILDNQIGKTTLWVGDDNAKDLIYSTLGFINSYSHNVVDRTISLTVYSSDKY